MLLSVVIGDGGWVVVVCHAAGILFLARGVNARRRMLRIVRASKKREAFSFSSYASCSASLRDPQRCLEKRGFVLAVTRAAAASSPEVSGLLGGDIVISRSHKIQAPLPQTRACSLLHRCSVSAPPAPAKGSAHPSHSPLRPPVRSSCTTMNQLQTRPSIAALFRPSSALVTPAPWRRARLVEAVPAKHPIEAVDDPPNSVTTAKSKDMLAEPLT